MTNFVTKIGTQLYLKGKPFRFAGGNSYDLGDTGRNAFEIDDTFDAYKEMGLTVMRDFTVGQSFGFSGGVMPSPGVFDDTSFSVKDYMIKRAGDYGIKLVLDFFSNWPGINSRYTIQGWLGLSSPDQFYTDSGAIALEQQYVSHMLNHVNIYTGVAWKDDPTILCWETGNEMGINNNALVSTVPAWTSMIATFIRSIDSNHLIMDGSDQSILSSAVTSNADIVTAHYYGVNASNISYMQSQVALAAANNKVFTVGEYGWDQNYSLDLQSWLGTALSNKNIAGTLFWEYHGRFNTFGWRDPWPGQNDMHYPGNETQDRAARIQYIRNHAYAMSGLSVPQAGKPNVPLITSIDSTGVHNIVKWRGSIPSSTYSLERNDASTSNRWIVVNNQLTDYSPPYTDTTAPSGKQLYRIRGINLNGVTGAYSPAYSSDTQGIGLGQDTFNRIVLANNNSFWGYATDNQTWSSISSSNSRLGALNGSGTIAATFGSPTVIMRLGKRTGTIMEGVIRWSVVVTADTPAIYLRINDSTHYYSLSVLGTTLTIGKRSGGSFTSLATTSVLIPGVGNHYWFHFKVSGTVLTGKLWPDGAPEPSAWMVSATDSSITSGGIGLGAVPTTTSPVTFDHFNVVQPQNAPPVALVSTKARK